MSDAEVARRRITALLEEIMTLNKQLWAKGIDAADPADRQEAGAILKRITERAYGGKA